ncbi:MAG: BamA/TamA family outer membrane protein [Bryobacteraceae bacterium]
MARVSALTMGAVAAMAALGVRPAAGQPEKYEGRRILTIQFEPAVQPMEPDAIYRMLPLRVGQPLRLADVRESIYRLYNTGQYKDLRVDARLVGEEVAMTFLTQNSWFIGRASADKTVKEPPNNGQLVNATGLRLGEAYRPERVKDAADSLQQLLESNGFFESRVEPRFEYEARTQQIHIRFVINAGRRAYFETPEVRGDFKLPVDRIVKFTRWHGWLGWRAATLSRTQRGLEGIRRYYRREDRLMAKVSLDEMNYNPGGGRVTPSLSIDAGPKVEVHTIGAKVPRSKLMQLIPIYEEGTVDRDLLVEGSRNLRDYFQTRGYFETEVEFKQQRVRNDRAAIDYLINTGPRQRVESVNVAGNRYFDEQTIRERMFTLPRSFQFRRGRFSETLLRRDEEAVASLYRANGFRDVNVSSAVTPAGGPKRGLKVAMTIEEGPQWRVAKLEIEGVRSFEPSQLLELCTSQEGQPFSEFQIAVDRDAVLAWYYAEGFSEALFEWSSTPAEKPNSVNVKYVVQEGRRKYVRQVLISGLQTTQPALVNRTLTLNPGDPLSSTRMAETQQRLYDLGIFARVNAAVQNPEGDLEEKYVLYQVEEANRYSVTGGLGAEIARIGGNQASFDSPAGSPGFSPRVSLDASRLNFRGIGHTVSFRSRLSNIQQRALVNYTAPRLGNVRGRDLSFTALIENASDIRTFESRRREGSVQLSQRLSKANTALFRFAYRRVGVDNLKIADSQIPTYSQPVRIGILSANFIQDKRDDPTDSTRGAFNTADFGLASRYFGSQANFPRFLGRNTTYHAFGRRKYVLARSLTFGWQRPFGKSLDPRSTEADIPIAERFFSGGANSHRGFPENQAGPRDLDTGFPLGGRALLMNNLEMRFPLAGENLRGVLFHDAGNVYSRFGDISIRARQRDVTDFDYMAHAVGFGVRYRTPIGPVRLDFAYSANSPRFERCVDTATGSVCQKDTLSPNRSIVSERISRFQFHFSIGQSF